MQALFIPTTYDKKCLVPNIIEEHKLQFNLHIIFLMFMNGPPLHLTQPIHLPDTWDICLATEPNMHNIDQIMHDELKVPITDIDDRRINYCSTHWGCTPPMSYSNWGDSLRRQECLRTFCRQFYSQPDLKRPHQLSVR